MIGVDSYSISHPEAERTEPSLPSDNFDVFRKKTMASIIDFRGRPLGEWSLSDADSKETCARFVLGVLRDRPNLRRRFPDATSVATGLQRLATGPWSAQISALPTRYLKHSRCFCTRAFRAF